MSTRSIDARMSRLEGAFEQVSERLSSMERRFDQRFESIDQRFESIDQRFNWVIGTVLATWITTILAIIFHR
jgi:tetrahydromethanopterin S-methyltransferase subunit G